ncbi:lysosomal acid glucosylceramidase-like [Belonocnema kinseyi]|uniref:lysosomal acid glucosylceramidase-like n=1 Tax=Belonocnema kinseyi TaxID=2817044 RepID=UPI00143D8819|nr:lysosomal acid glucosylceramidase-like [Belonocnema kinseyi]
MKVQRNLSGANECVPRDFGEDSTVCVCNSTYCDSTPETSLEAGTFLWYVSSQAGQRMDLTVGQITDKKKASIILRPNSSKRYQKLQGFGGSITDSAGINIRNLSLAAQEKLLKSYFSKSGSRYNLVRIPIGGSDFSTRFYTYDDVPNDVLLKNFSLAQEDINYKIPLMQKALDLNPELRFMAAAWTAPVWMKTNNNYTGYGFLKKKYFQLYTDYLLKFMNEYKKHNIKMWAISTGNEPFTMYISILVPFNSMGWKSEDVGTFIADNLGPSLTKSQHNETIILALDDQKIFLPWLVDRIFKKKEAKKFVSGIAFHYYADIIVPAFVLDQTHQKYPEKILIMSEACEGPFPWQTVKVRLGYWRRGEKYVLKMFQNLNHWTSGWVDWNLALNKVGGPNWVNNFVDASIIVNPETDEFFKQPLYYIIHHFSRFLPRGSVRIELKESSIIFHSLTSIAFETPHNKTVVLIYNGSERSQKVDIINPKTGIINLNLPEKSLNTIVYQS